MRARVRHKRVGRAEQQLEQDDADGPQVVRGGARGERCALLQRDLGREENMLNSFSDFRLGEHRFTNLEMECSALFALSKSLGHKAAAICLGLANRRKKEFSSNYEARIRTLIEYVLERI